MGRSFYSESQCKICVFRFLSKLSWNPHIQSDNCKSRLARCDVTLPNPSHASSKRPREAELLPWQRRHLAETGRRLATGQLVNLRQRAVYCRIVNELTSTRTVEWCRAPPRRSVVMTVRFKVQLNVAVRFSNWLAHRSFPVYETTSERSLE